MVFWVDAQGRARFQFYDVEALAEQAAKITGGSIWVRDRSASRKG